MNYKKPKPTEIMRCFQIVFEFAFNELHQYIISRAIPIDDVIFELDNDPNHFIRYIESALFYQPIPHWVKVNWITYEEYRTDKVYELLQSLAKTRLQSSNYEELYQLKTKGITNDTEDNLHPA